MPAGNVPKLGIECQLRFQDLKLLDSRIPFYDNTEPSIYNPYDHDPKVVERPSYAGPTMSSGLRKTTEFVPRLWQSSQVANYCSTVGKEHASRGSGDKIWYPCELQSELLVSPRINLVISPIIPYITFQ